MAVTDEPVPAGTGSADASDASDVFDAWARTTVITVTHNSGGVIGRCLGALIRARRIIVVDNASGDDSLASAAAAAPRSEVVSNGVGLGYGNGANQALEKVATEFALLVNPDAVLRAGALEALVAAADAYPEAAMLGPRLFHPDGTVALSHDAPLFRRGGLRRSPSGEAPPEGPCCVGYLSGAVTLVRMAPLRATGFYDPAFFLYYEDDDLCLRLRAAGYQLVLVPEAGADHLGGGSVRPGWGSHWEKFFHMAWSRLYIEAKYRGAGASRRLAWLNALCFGAKALGYGIAVNPKKAVRDAARTAGSLAYLFGRPASRTVRRARPSSSPLG